MDITALSKVNEAGVKTITYLRSRLANSEQKLKALQGVADVPVSKQKLAIEREEYLLEELGRTAKDLLCKQKPPSMFDFSAGHAMTHCFFTVGIEPHPNTERQWVEGKIVAGSGSSNSHASNFWSDRRRGFILVMLQARVQQVQRFVE